MENTKQFLSFFYSFFNLKLLLSFTLLIPSSSAAPPPPPANYSLLPRDALALLAFKTISSAAPPPPPANYSLLPRDALALLAFKTKADLHNNLPYFSHKRFDYCHWLGVKCAQGRVVRLVIERLSLGGSFEPDTLTRLDQLRVLTLQNTSLTGPIPDLSQLINLKTLFLDHNSFSGHLLPSLSTLHRLTILDLSHNNLTGPISTELTLLDRIYYLRLDSNSFNGTIPPFNQSFLEIFNVSGNNLTGDIPVTITLSRFNGSSFSQNPGLQLPFFRPPVGTAPSPGANQQVQVLALPLRPSPSLKKQKKYLLILGFSAVTLLAIGSLVSLFIVVRKKRRRRKRVSMVERKLAGDEEEEREMRKIEVRKSGNLLFCAGEGQDYSMEQLMRGSAEMLGRGTIGTTYKAVLENQMIVCVKRLDGNKIRNTSGEVFERHIEVVGRLRHPNLVPLRAYFHAKEERLLIYDYQSNGSIFSLVHGLRSTRAKPLHWTSCLKIAEDVAQGLAYIHQTSNLVHGNLKASNVLLGADFEACLTDYALSMFTNTSPHHEDDVDFTGYKAPEVHNSTTSTSKSDVYAFGVLLMELLTSKPPLQHPFLMPRDVMNWVMHARGEEEGDGEDSKLEMLVNIATKCSRTSPEKRPSMGQVLEMIQKIKEIVTRESDSSTLFF